MVGEIYAAFTLFTEKPRGKFASEPGADAIMTSCLDNASRLREIFENKGKQFHFAPIGSWIEAGINIVGEEKLREVYGGFPIVNHTYSHNVLKPVAGRNAGCLDVLEEDLTKAQGLIKKVWGKTPEGFISPCGYYKGFFEDSPENEKILGILKKVGFKWSVADARGVKDSLYMPLVDDEESRLRQPFTYNNGIVEIPPHCWQDVAFKHVHPNEKPADAPMDDDSILRTYTNLYLQAGKIVGQTGRDIFLGLQLHSDFMHGPSTTSGGWAKDDAKLDICNRILGDAIDKGINVVTLDDFYLLNKN